jgi:hypothetical protein
MKVSALSVENGTKRPLLRNNQQNRANGHLEQVEGSY